MKLTDAQLWKAFTTLGITPEDLRKIQHAASVEIAEVALKELKTRVKRRYREAVQLVHPDHAPPGTPIEEFLVLQSGMKYIESLTVSPPKKPLRYRIRRVY